MAGRLRALAYRRYDAFTRRVASILPERVVMRCYWRVVGHATSGEHGATNASTLTVFEAAKRWPVD